MTTDGRGWGPRGGHRGPPWRVPRYVLPAVVGAIELGGTAAANSHDGTVLPPAAALALVAGAAALIWRRRYPIPVLITVLAATFAASVWSPSPGPVFFALIVAFFTAVLRGHRVAAGVVLVAGYGAFTWLAPALRGEGAPSLAQALGLGAWLLVLATVAEVARGRRERAIEYRRRHREEQRRQASEERLRIARELHDVLAHNISLINVQAGVALHLMDERPEQARTALAAIKDASNEALGELRSVLDILRQSGDAAPRSPTSGLADLDTLIHRTQAAGMDVTCTVTGDARPVGAGVDLAAFRIVQEALTNVTRHAGRQASAAVTIGYGGDVLSIRIDDTGVGSASATGSGNGIAGMRERATALGGTLQAGPRPSGGFSVHATLPLRDGAAE